MFLRVRFAECGITAQIAATPEQPESGQIHKDGFRSADIAANARDRSTRLRAIRAKVDRAQGPARPIRGCLLSSRARPADALGLRQCRTHS
jgi:hypothetical protein